MSAWARLSSAVRRRPFVSALVALSVLIVFLLAGISILLYSESGRNALARYLENAISTPGEFEIDLGRLHGTLPVEVRIDRVTVSDSAGDWLVVRDIELDWSPLDLLGARLRIDSLRAREFAILRRPAPRAQTPPAPRSRSTVSLPPLEIDLEHAEIADLRLEEAVLGQAANLTLSASATALRDRARTRLAIERTDGIPGQARVVMEWDAAAGSLDIDGFLSEPANGLVAGLMDLPGRPALDISIAGEGPASDWQGHLELGAGSLISLVSSLSISIEQDFRLAIQGDAVPGTSLGPATMALLGPRTAFDLAVLHEADKQNWSISIADLASAAIAARGKAEIDVAAQHIDGLIEVETVDSGRLAPMLEPAAFRSAATRVSFAGPVTHPAIKLEATAENPSAEGFAAAKANLQAALRPDRPLDDGEVSIAMDAEARFEGMETPSPELSALLGGTPRIGVDGAVLEEYARIKTGKVTVSGDKAETTLNGEVALDSGAVQASGQVEIGDLAPLSARAGRALSGNLRAGFVLTRDAEGAIGLALDGSLRDPGLDLTVAETLLGPDVGFAGKVHYRPDGMLSLSDLRLAGKGLTAKGRLSLPPGAGRLDADYDISISDLAALGIADPLREDGRLGISGTAAGPPANPTISGSMNLAAAAPGGYPVRRAEAQFSVSGVATGPRGEIRLEAETELIPDLSGRTGFALEQDILTLTALQVTARGTVAEGKLALPLDGRATSGDLTLRAADIAPWSALAGRTLRGGLEGRVKLSGEGVRQDAVLDIKASEFALDEQLSARRIDLKMRAGDLAGNLTLKGTASGVDMRGGPAQMREIALDIDGPLDSLAYRLRATGQLRNRDIGLNASGRLNRQDNRTTLTVATLSGTAADIPVRLTEPATLELEPAIDTGDIQLAVGDGTMRGRFRQDEDRVSMRAEGDAIPLASLWPAAPPQLDRSIIDMSASLDGPAANPTGRLDMTVSGLAAGETENLEEGLTLAAKAELGNGKFAASGSIQGLPDVTAAVEASLPARLSLAPAAFTVDEKTPMTGRIVYRGPVGSGWALMGLDRHKLEGQVDLAVDISGTLGTPRVSGRAELADGRYENFDTGTILTEMQVSAHPSDSSITIDKATASDGNGGEISLAGRVDFGGGELLDLDLTTDLRKARLVRRDELTAVASGKLTLRGGAARRIVSGRLEIDEAEVRLVGGRPAGIVEIPVEETGTPPPGATPPPPPARPSRTELDLEISMPKRVFVRGRGLDSEWGGDLKVTGTSSSPRVQGQLRPLRGRYDFAGKIFTLREGSIAFAGNDEIDPALDLSAERRATDITAIIHLTGTARKPEITLESIPDYPQDEVLSRVLFNKSTGRLSAGEALQLAQAVGTLSGASDGGGIMDFARGMLRLDVLRFSEQTEDSEGGAEAGKYINDRIYLGVEGTATGETGVTVEIEITPRLKLEGDIGPKDKSQTGLKWKRDY